MGEQEHYSVFVISTKCNVSMCTAKVTVEWLVNM